MCVCVFVCSVVTVLLVKKGKIDWSSVSCLEIAGNNNCLSIFLFSQVLNFSEELALGEKKNLLLLFI